MKQPLLLATMTTLALTVSPVAGDDGTYEVAIDRPARAGQTTRMQCEASYAREVTASVLGGEQQLEKTVTSIDFEAEIKVIAVDAQGQPMRMSCAVERCVVQSDGDETTPMRRGETLSAWRSDEAIFYELDGEPVSDQLARLLTMVVPFGDPSMSTLDRSPTTRTVGEEWSMDAGRAAANLTTVTGLPVDVTRVSATRALAQSGRRDGRPCLTVQSNIAAEQVAPPLGQVPPGFQLSRSTLNLDRQTVVPTEMIVPVLHDATETAFDAVLIGSIGSNDAEMTIHEAWTVIRETTPISPGFADASSDG